MRDSAKRGQSGHDRVRTIAALLGGAGLIGCTPMVKYQSETNAWKTGSVRPLESGEILYALPLTRLTLDIDNAKPVKAEDKEAAEMRNASCAQDFLACLNDVNVRASSFVDDDAQTWRLSPTTFYLFYGRTALSAAPGDADERYPRTVVVYYENTGKNAVVAGGAAFVAVYSFGLVPAIVAAAAAPLVSATLGVNGKPAKPKPVAVNEGLICEPDKKAYAAWLKAQNSANDHLPTMPPNNAVIRVSSASLQSSGSTKCWNLLSGPPPKWRGAESDAESTSGWLFRVVLDEKKHGFATVPRTSFVADGESKGTMPAPACVRARLQMLWWKSLPPDEKDSFAFAPSLGVTVADPAVAQEITIPKDGSINFDAVCGAYASLKSVPTTSADSMGALIKAVGDSRGESQKKK